jgi:hypothetical protein
MNATPRVAAVLAMAHESSKMQIPPHASAALGRRKRTHCAACDSGFANPSSPTRGSVGKGAWLALAKKVS